MLLLAATDSPRKCRAPKWLRFSAWMLTAFVLLPGCLYVRSFLSALELIPAIYDRDYKRVETALVWGADVNGCKPDGFTPLMRAASAPLQESKRDFVLLLLAHGANLNQRDANGRTALDHARYDAEISRLLKQHGATE